MKLFILVCLLSLFLQLISANLEVSHVRPREKAPKFKAKAVMDDKFIDVELSHYSEAGKWTILLFYPFDYTFVCPTEIISFSEKADNVLLNV